MAPKKSWKRRLLSRKVLEFDPPTRLAALLLLIVFKNEICFRSLGSISDRAVACRISDCIENHITMQKGDYQKLEAEPMDTVARRKRQRSSSPIPVHSERNSNKAVKRSKSLGSNQRERRINEADLETVNKVRNENCEKTTVSKDIQLEDKVKRKLENILMNKANANNVKDDTLNECENINNLVEEISDTELPDSPRNEEKHLIETKDVKEPFSNDFLAKNQSLLPKSFGRRNEKDESLNCISSDNGKAQCTDEWMKEISNAGLPISFGKKDTTADITLASPNSFRGREKSYGDNRSKETESYRRNVKHIGEKSKHQRSAGNRDWNTYEESEVKQQYRTEYSSHNMFKRNNRYTRTQTDPRFDKFDRNDRYTRTQTGRGFDKFKRNDRYTSTQTSPRFDAFDRNDRYTRTQTSRGFDELDRNDICTRTQTNRGFDKFERNYRYTRTQTVPRFNKSDSKERMKEISHTELPASFGRSTTLKSWIGDWNNEKKSETKKSHRTEYPGYNNLDRNDRYTRTQSNHRFNKSDSEEWMEEISKAGLPVTFGRTSTPKPSSSTKLTQEEYDEWVRNALRNINN